MKIKQLLCESSWQAKVDIYDNVYKNRN